MPTESTPLPSPAFQVTQTIIKCSICGSASAGSTSSSAMPRTQAAGAASGGEVVLLHDPIERICGSCFRSAESRELSDAHLAHDDQVDCQDEDVNPRSMLDVDLAEAERRLNGMTVGTEVILPDQSAVPRPREMPRFVPASPSASFGPSSLPSYPTLPWSTFKPIVSIPEGTTLSGRATPAGRATPKRPASPQPLREAPPAQHIAPSLPARHFTPSPSPPLSPTSKQAAERPYNPLVDLTSARVPNTGRGALYPGSVFKGTQASGRSAYEVEIRILDVSFASSTLSGYLSISHLTDSHPHLTTFFTGEIIGPQYGFITGPRFSATEHDDMRHWGRFEQFRRPSTRADMVRPDLLFRDPQPDRTRGEVKGKERDFVFLRIKERFLVPDHRVRDISGASFAGFYYAMVDLRPSATAEVPPSPSSPKTTIISTAPVVPRRQSAGLIRRQSSSAPAAELAGQPSPGITQAQTAGEARTPSRPRMRRDSSARQSDIKEERREATLRGYYFHSLNQEPFQELFLTHVPQRGAGTFEFR